MKKTGFTLVELLAVIVIIGLIAIIMIPGLTSISNRLRVTNRDNKIIMIRNAAIDYAEKDKDMIKENECVEYTIEHLIREGKISVEKEVKDGSSLRPILIDPVTNQELTGTVSVCYCDKTYALVAIFDKQNNQDIC